MGSNYWTQVFIITLRTLWVPLSPGPWSILFLIFYFNISYVISFATLNFFSWALNCFLLYVGNLLISVIFLLKSIWGFAIHQSFIYETVPKCNDLILLISDTLHGHFATSQNSVRPDFKLLHRLLSFFLLFNLISNYGHQLMEQFYNQQI